MLAESECTSVHFRALTDEEIHAYIATGEPLGQGGRLWLSGSRASLWSASRAISST